MSNRSEVLPQSIKLLNFISDHVEKASPAFIKNSPEQQLLKTLIESNDTLLNQKEFKRNPHLITFIQLLSLSIISTLDNRTLPELENITITNDSVTLKWPLRLWDRITIGKSDRSMRLFLTAISHRIFNQPKSAEPIGKTLLLLFKHRLEATQKTLETSISQIDTLLKLLNKSTVKITKDIHPDTLFVLIASLPSDELNVLYNYLSKFLPQELKLPTRSGFLFEVFKFFKIPATNVRLSLEKMKMHFNLFFFSDQESIREETHEKVLEKLTDLLKHPQTQAASRDQLTQIKENHLQTKKHLLSLFSQTLGDLLN